MTRYRARDIERLRRLKDGTPRREVPHTVRSLAERIGTHYSTLGYLLTGERPTVDEQVAKGFAEEYGLTLEDLFLPEASASEDEEEGRSA
jgi:transcriptional regulator with XRE-family HTH domain